MPSEAPSQTSERHRLDLNLVLYRREEERSETPVLMTADGPLSDYSHAGGQSEQGLNSL